MTNRKFYKKTITLEFLSESEFPYMDVENLVFEAREGDYSMRTVSEDDNEIDGKQAAEALLNHASDPSFFSLTEKGEDLE